jgi:hypothetical protein
MEIADTRHQTPDRFSIKEVFVHYDWSSNPSAWVSPYLVINLKPEGYMRDRFGNGGASYETKKHGARQIRIHASEFKLMMDAFSNEVDICHQVLVENGLIPELIEARQKATLKERTSKEG